jgi:phage shock protein A
VADIERESLDAHVSLCELRYQALEHRLVQVEESLASLQTLLLQIRDSLAQLPAQQTQLQAQKWERVQWGLIGVLAGVAGWALVRVFQ